MPLLLSMNTLSLLTPNPLPKSASVTTAQSQSTSLKPPPATTPFPPVRKALRILSDTPEATPTDASYVYSGYAPISARLVQCVAMKGGVLGNLAGGGIAAGGGQSSVPDAATAGGGGGTGVSTKVEKVAAHPISGWKGFEDAVKTVQGAIVDEVQKGDRDATISQPVSGRSQEIA